MRKASFFIILMVIMLSLMGCKGNELSKADDLIAKEVNKTNENRINEYEIQVELDAEDMSYKGKQKLIYVNNTTEDLEELYFHLYPNAFKTLEQAPILFNTIDYINPIDYVPGYIEIEKANLKGIDLEWSIMEDIETILAVKLNEPLKKGKTLELYLEFMAKLPSTSDRYGYHDKGINCGNWYPIVCVYDEKGWNLDPYYQIGDPFYSEVSNYKVSITAPKEWVVATSGSIVSETNNEDKNTYNIEGQLIRDFAWVASKDFTIKQRKVDGIVIKLYSTNNDRNIMNKALDISEKAIQTFNKKFGKYPYKEYTVVITKFPSGMEYPSIVLISDEFFHKNLIHILEKIIVHETAHQWWYAVVGNHQVNEPWLDEGLTTYSEVIYINENYGKEKGQEYYINNIKWGYEYATRYFGENEIVNKPLSEFVGWDDYSLLVYTRAAMFLDRIKEDFGEEILFDILQKYYEEYKYRIATTEDFINICEEITNKSFTSLRDEYLQGNKSNSR